MARVPHEGTPRESRSKAYVYPPRKRTVLWASLVVGLVLIATLIGGYAAGLRRTLSPGDVASHHARIDLKCAQCHNTGKQVEAIRCERCHDTNGSERLTHAAHVLLGSGDTRKAEMAEMTECATCHTEHRGLTASLRKVDDRECATCHGFPSLAKHPEFAAVRAQATPGVGLKFNHDVHIVEAQRTRGATCQICHVETNDKKGFAPMSFDQHCKSCHAPEGTFNESDPILGELLVPPTLLPADWKARTSVQLQARGRKQVASMIRHRDGWVMFNALRIRQSIDRDGEAAERLTLRARVAYLQQLLAVRPVYEASAKDLQDEANALQSEIADIDGRLGQSGAADADAIRETLLTAQAIAKQLADTQPDAKGDAQPILQASLDTKGPPAAPTDSDAQGRFDRRKAELAKLLDTISARTGDEGVKQRAAALKAEIQKLSAPSAATDADRAALLDRLGNLDDVLATVRAIPDPGVQSQVAQIDLLRTYGKERVAAGLNAEDFQARKAELLDLLDSIERRGAPNVRLRIAPLRQRILALRAGSTGDLELQRARRQRQKQLDRVRLELELLSSQSDYEAPKAQDDSVDQATLRQTLQVLQQQLTDLERAPRMSAAQSPEDRESRKNELDALLSRCLKCHEYDPTGVRLAPVRIAEPVMPRSVFNHAPHVTQTKCETCHDPTPAKPGQAAAGEKHFGVSWSKLATDINSPGVANCQMCHKPSQAKSDCETCHVYHPSSPAKLVAVTR